VARRGRRRSGATGRTHTRTPLPTTVLRWRWSRSLNGLVDESALWARQRECWDRTVLALGGQPVVIPYEETTFPGFFISAGDGRRPVADVLSLRPGVDVARMAIVGLEMGGFGVARALVGERRFAAALLVPGILDAGRPWTDRLPDGARAALLEEDPGLFDRELQIASLFAPGIEAQLRRYGRWFGGDGGTVYELYRQISTFRLGDEVHKIDTPTTASEPLDGSCWAGQAADLARRLGSVGTLVRSYRAEDAIMAWLDTVF
jgi:hypothetical protein